MNNLNLSDLTLEDFASWPVPVKAAVMVIVVIVLFSASYMFHFKDQLVRFRQLEKTETDLIRTVETKQQFAANLSLYRTQLELMKKTFGALLMQLPGKTEIPELLEEISKTGIWAGLKFQLFDPQPEVVHDFYVEVPIKIIVNGTYQQIATFVSKVAGMRRIVTLHDFEIKFPGAADRGRKPIRKIDGRLPLIMSVTAKIYRYKAFE